MSIDWRASLVPAAAVIPAPTAYIEVVAVKKLVVEFLPRTTGPPTGWVPRSTWASSWETWLYFIVRREAQDFYLEEIRVFQAGSRLEYISME